MILQGWVSHGNSERLENIIVFFIFSELLVRK